MAHKYQKRRTHNSAKKKGQKSILASIPKPYLFGGIGVVAVLVIALIILAGTGLLMLPFSSRDGQSCG